MARTIADMRSWALYDDWVHLGIRLVADFLRRSPPWIRNTFFAKTLRYSLPSFVTLRLMHELDIDPLHPLPRAFLFHLGYHLGEDKWEVGEQKAFVFGVGENRVSNLGMLGSSRQEAIYTPRPVPFLCAHPPSLYSIGDGHSVFVLRDGRVFMTGRTRHVTGIDADSTIATEPTTIPLVDGLSGVSAVFVGLESTALLCGSAKEWRGFVGGNICGKWTALHRVYLPNNSTSCCTDSAMRSHLIEMIGGFHERMGGVADVLPLQIDNRDYILSFDHGVPVLRNDRDIDFKIVITVGGMLAEPLNSLSIPWLAIVNDSKELFCALRMLQSPHTSLYRGELFALRPPHWRMMGRKSMADACCIVAFALVLQPIAGAESIRQASVSPDGKNLVFSTQNCHDYVPYQQNQHSDPPNLPACDRIERGERHPEGWVRPPQHLSSVPKPTHQEDAEGSNVVGTMMRTNGRLEDFVAFCSAAEKAKLKKAMEVCERVKEYRFSTLDLAALSASVALAVERGLMGKETIEPGCTRGPVLADLFANRFPILYNEMRLHSHRSVHAAIEAVDSDESRKNMMFDLIYYGTASLVVEFGDEGQRKLVESLEALSRLADSLGLGGSLRCCQACNNDCIVHLRLQISRPSEGEEEAKVPVQELHIQCADKVQVICDKRVWAVHSAYVSTMLEYTPCLTLEFESSVVRLVDSVLRNPHLLCDENIKALKYILTFADFMQMNALAEDVAYALVYNAHFANIKETIECLLAYPPLEDQLVRLLSERPHVLGLWNVDNLPERLLCKICDNWDERLLLPLPQDRSHTYGCPDFCNIGPNRHDVLIIRSILATEYNITLDDITFADRAQIVCASLEVLATEQLVKAHELFRKLDEVYRSIRKSTAPIVVPRIAPSDGIESDSEDEEESQNLAALKIRQQSACEREGDKGSDEH